MLTEKMIKALEKKGFNRWQKGDKDRLYINAEDLGLELSHYKSGNVSAAWMDGERISNTEGRRLSGAKTYIDVATGELHGTHETLTEKAQAIYDEVSEAVAAEEAEEKKPADAAVSSIKIEYYAGESRYGQYGVDYMINVTPIEDEDGDEVELYAELQNDTDDECATEDELKAEIIRQAVEKGIDPSRLNF